MKGDRYAHALAIKFYVQRIYVNEDLGGTGAPAKDFIYSQELGITYMLYTGVE